MIARGRPRKNEDHRRLPKYVYLKKGRYVYVPYLGGGRFGKEVVLCPGGSDIRHVWRAYDALTADESTGTLNWLCQQYVASMDHKDKHPRTQKDYEACMDVVIGTTLRNGARFGDIPIRTITPGAIRKYRDSRAKKARVRANRELAFLSVAFSWGLEHDYVTTNPVKGVRRLKEQARTRYVEDSEYTHVFNLAKSPPYIKPAMELAYLMRLRLSEALALQHSDIRDDGVLARRTKGSKTQIVGWSNRLHAAVDSAESKAAIKSFYVIHDAKGQPIRTSTFQTAWNRLMKTAIEKGLTERFTFHDLKAKGVTDFDGDKQKAAGHRSAQMADVYNRKPEKTPSTR
jgi:integrase